MSNSSSPRVTFVMPSFNEAPAILLASLRSVSNQMYADFECLVIDESTSSKSIAACMAHCENDNRFRRIAPSSRIGLAASLNVGLSQARGEFVARFDSDDICLPDRLLLQVATMDAHPEIGVLGGGMEIINDDGDGIAFRTYPTSHDAISRRFHFTTPIAHPTALIRRKILEEVGGYDTRFRFAEDLDLWLRMLNSGVKFANLERAVVQYRQQNTRRSSAHWRYNLRARRKNFAPSSILPRIAGMGLIGLWICTPPSVQEMIFESLLLKRKTSQSAWSA